MVENRDPALLTKCYIKVQWEDENGSKHNDYITTHAKPTEAVTQLIQP